MIPWKIILLFIIILRTRYLMRAPMNALKIELTAACRLMAGNNRLKDSAISSQRILTTNSLTENQFFHLLIAYPWFFFPVSLLSILHSLFYYLPNHPSFCYNNFLETSYNG